SWAPSTPSLFKKSSQDLGLRDTFQIVPGVLDVDGGLDAIFANLIRNNTAVWLKNGDETFVDIGQRLTQYMGMALGWPTLMVMALATWTGMAISMRSSVCSAVGPKPD
ncbi:MAG: hypothetical protein JW862_05430, partial [Anaerolineales bacterium]|nr:hypothetical protein [Anaerolineales bacterium]